MVGIIQTAIRLSKTLGVGLVSRLIVVSNRVALPKETRAGGLAAAMNSALSPRTVASGSAGQGRAVESPGRPTEQSEGEITYVTVDLTRAEYDAYYNGFANRTLWPLLHYRLDWSTTDATPIACTSESIEASPALWRP